MDLSSQPESEIWIQIGGDKGGGTTKFYLNCPHIQNELSQQHHSFLHVCIQWKCTKHMDLGSQTESEILINIGGDKGGGPTKFYSNCTHIQNKLRQQHNSFLYVCIQ